MNDKREAAAMRADAYRLLLEADKLDSQSPIRKADLLSMTPDQIVKAREAGKLDAILRGEEAK